MSKIIIAENCESCPYLEFIKVEKDEFGFKCEMGYDKYICKFHHRKIVEDIKLIPKWCRLKENI